MYLIQNNKQKSFLQFGFFYVTIITIITNILGNYSQKTFAK